MKFEKFRYLIYVIPVLVLIICSEIALSFLSVSGEEMSGQKRNIRLREFPPNSVLFVQASSSKSDKQLIEYKIETDADGFIEPSGIAPAPRFSIVFLGGSTTECGALPENKRFPFLVGERFREELNLDVNTYNGGVSGNNTMHSFNILVNKIIPMAPEFVVLMHNVNDRDVLSRLGTYWNDHPTRTLLSIDKQKSLIAEYVEILKLTVKKTLPEIYKLTKSALSSKSNAKDEWENYRGSVVEQNIARIVQEFRKAQLVFVRTARVFGIEPVLMTQGHLKPADLLKPGVHELFNRTIRDIGRTEGVVVIDIDKTVSGRPEYFYDDIHLSEKGSEAVAGAIYDEFSRILHSRTAAIPRIGRSRGEAHLRHVSLVRQREGRREN